MPSQINVAGLVTVKIDAGEGIETLGECLDMADTTDQAFHHDVSGDRHGGPQGPPIDVQFLGRVVRARLELSRYDRAVLNKCRARVASSTAVGTVPDSQIGTLLLQGGQSIRVILSTANDAYNFPTCVVREAFELPLGTKFSAAIVEFEAHRNQTTGVLYNAITT